MIQSPNHTKKNPNRPSLKSNPVPLVSENALRHILPNIESHRSRLPAASQKAFTGCARAKRRYHGVIRARRSRFSPYLSYFFHYCLDPLGFINFFVQPQNAVFRVSRGPRSRAIPDADYRFITPE